MSTTNRWWRPVFRDALECRPLAMAPRPELSFAELSPAEQKTVTVLFGRRWKRVVHLVCSSCGRTRTWAEYLHHMGDIRTAEAVLFWMHVPDLCAPCVLQKRTARPLRLLDPAVEILRMEISPSAFFNDAEVIRVTVVAPALPSAETWGAAFVDAADAVAASLVAQGMESTREGALDRIELGFLMQMAEARTPPRQVHHE